MDVMGEPIQERTGQVFLTKGDRPFVERLARDDDGGATLVVPTD